MRSRAPLSRHSTLLILSSILFFALLLGLWSVPAVSASTVDRHHEDFTTTLYKDWLATTAT